MQLGSRGQDSMDRIHRLLHPRPDRVAVGLFCMRTTAVSVVSQVALRAERVGMLRY
jgi:hypothetical protein